MEAEQELGATVVICVDIRLWADCGVAGEDGVGVGEDNVVCGVGLYVVAEPSVGERVL